MAPTSRSKARPSNDCPCGSGVRYGDCCRPFHLHQSLPPTAEALMRSRYSAFAKRIESYLLSSWAPETRPESLHLDRRQHFTGLTILRTQDGGVGDAGGIVEFVAVSERDGVKDTLHETSRFRRLTEEDDRWVYLDGTVR